MAVVVVVVVPTTHYYHCASFVIVVIHCLNSKNNNTAPVHSQSISNPNTYVCIQCAAYHTIIFNMYRQNLCIIAVQREGGAVLSPASPCRLRTHLSRFRNVFLDLKKVFCTLPSPQPGILPCTTLMRMFIRSYKHIHRRYNVDVTNLLYVPKVS